MINDIIEIKINDVAYSARLDMGAIAECQHKLQKLKKNIGVVEMLDQVKEENYLVVNNIIIESIKRCHPTLKDENILENMKLHDKNRIVAYVFELMSASLPSTDDDKKKTSGVVNPYKKVQDWDFSEMEYIYYSVLKRNNDFWSITPKYFFKQWDAHKRFNGLDKQDSNREVVNGTECG